MSDLDWLLVGALGVETGPVLAALEGRHVHSRRLMSGRLGGARVAVLTCGVGPAKAERRTRAALQAVRVGAVVSFGTCGALVDHLDVGEVIAVSEVRFEDRCRELTPLASLRPVICQTVSEAVWSAARRDQLAAAGAEICEMEAFAVSRAAGALPFHALKVVSDHAGGTIDPAVGKPREKNPLVIGRFLARAARLSKQDLLPALVAAVASGTATTG